MFEAIRATLLVSGLVFPGIAAYTAVYVTLACMALSLPGVERDVLRIHRADDRARAGADEDFGEHPELFARAQYPQMCQATCRPPRSNEGDLGAVHHCRMHRSCGFGKSTVTFPERVAVEGATSERHFFRHLVDDVPAALAAKPEEDVVPEQALASQAVGDDGDV